MAWDVKSSSAFNYGSFYNIGATQSYTLVFYYVRNMDEIDIDGISKNVPCKASPLVGDMWK